MLSYREHRAFFEPKAYGKIKLTSSGYDPMPRFAFPEEPAGAAVSQVITGLTGLLALAMPIGWFGLWSLRRYSPAG